METKSILPNLDVADIFKCAWAYTKKHFMWVAIIMFLSYMVTAFPNSYYNMSYLSALMASGGHLTEEQWVDRLVEDNPVYVLKMFLGILVASIIAGFIRVYLELVNYRVLMSAIETDNVDLTAALKGAFKGYWFFWIVSLVQGILITMGLLFCLLPGIFLSIRLLFVPILAAHKPELTFSEVFSRSWSMTEGHFFELLLLGVVVLLLNFFGFCLCCVGVIPTMIITYFMFAETYRRLLGEGGCEAPAGGAEKNAEEQQQAYVKEY